MTPSSAPDPRDLLVDLYTAATTAAAPGPALSKRLQLLHMGAGRRVWILALGKAAMPMAITAIGVLSSNGVDPEGGLVVAPAGGESPHPRIQLVEGDHPEPGSRSFAAANALETVVSYIAPDDEVWVLLSGGTTSLIGAPENGLSPADLSAIYSLLLGSGLDIVAMNRIRKRFSRWGAGRLARALFPALVRVYIVSDVIGDDLASIGSGPCVPDPTTAAEVRDLLDSAGLWSKLPEAARDLVLSAISGRIPETPKPGDPAFAKVAIELVASNRLAIEAVAKRAAELGLAPRLVGTPVAGEASTAGASVADSLLNNCVRSSVPQPNGKGVCMVWGGETTVSLGDTPTGLGGRSQELALAAARALAGAAAGTALLAAGTDGRDGPTDAAGAIVDGKTWDDIAARGRDPANDLARHDAYPALDCVGALLKPGLTGTNVMDVVIGICT